MNLFDLQAVLTLDASKYKEGLEDAKGKLSGFGNAFAKVGKAAGVAIAAASTAVVSLGKQAVESYANYEQLVGGVETLFAESADAVQKYADTAYKTAGMSANEYMETVTSFSASLLQSLDGDTAAAAEKADLAITDMSDNANKMGSSMESIQNAYQGFAKQNYTMLDNLKLGYGGTKEEMQRLLEDATAISGVEYDLESYGDIVDAIHIIQSEMGITGTTAKEASTTIQGSAASMKSAWQNLLTGIADDSLDFSALIDNLVESVGAFAENIIPRVEQVLSGIGDLVAELAPIIIERIPPLVEDILPDLLNSAVEIVLAVAEIVPDLLTTIIDTILNNADLLIDMVIDVTITLAEALMDAIPILLEKVPYIIQKLVVAVVQALPEIIKLGGRLITSLGEGITNMLDNFGEIITDFTENHIHKPISEFIENAKSWGKDLIENFISGIKEKFEALKESVGNVAETVKDFLGFSEPKKGALSNFHTYAPDMMKLFAQGIADNEGLITDQINKSFDFRTTAGVFGQQQMASGFGNSSGSDIILNITEELDGTTLARKMYRYNAKEQALRGTSLVRGIV